MPVCNKCGTKLEDENTFCPVCGAPIGADGAGTGTATGRSKDNPLPKILAVSVSAGAVLIGGVFVFAKVFKKDKENRQSEMTTAYSESYYQTTEEVTTTTTWETTTEYTTTTEAATTETTTETTSETTTETSVTSTTTKPDTTADKTRVTNAVNKTVKSDGKKYKFQVPKVIIPGKNTDAVNKQILNDNPISLADPKETSDVFEVTYSYYMNSKLISVLVRRENHTYMINEYFVYNVSIKTGKILTDKSFLSLRGTTVEKLLSTVKKIYSKMELSDEWFEQSDKDATLQMISMEYIRPYVNKKGQLCFVGKVRYQEGDEDYITMDVLFNAKTQQQIS